MISEEESTSTNDRRPLHNARTQGHVDIQIDSDIECQVPPFGVGIAEISSKSNEDLDY